jgi:hypothetical protein
LLIFFNLLKAILMECAAPCKTSGGWISNVFAAISAMDHFISFNGAFNARKKG